MLRINFIKHQMANMVLFLCFCVPVNSYAGEFKVNPLKLSFTPDTKSAALEVNNTSDQKITVQIETQAWSQDSAGKDLYEETTDILFFPKIVSLKPGEKRMLRVSYRGEKVKDREKSYRIFIQELIDRSRERTALNFSLRFSIPVFITPGNATADVKVSRVDLDEDSIILVVDNGGKAHSLIKNVQMTGLDEKRRELFFREQKGWYVLAGSSNTFKVPLSQDECRTVSSLEFAARGISKTYVTRLEKENISCH